MEVLSFRPLRSADVPLLQRMAATLFSEFGAYEEALLSWQEDRYVISEIAETVEGEPAGLLMLQLRQDRTAYLLAIGVVPSLQGKGFGKRLLRRVLEIAADLPAGEQQPEKTELWLSVAEDNHRARHLFASEGFLVQGPDQLLYENGQQALLMKKCL